MISRLVSTALLSVFAASLGTSHHTIIYVLIFERADKDACRFAFHCITSENAIAIGGKR